MEEPFRKRRRLMTATEQEETDQRISELGTNAITFPPDAPAGSSDNVYVREAPQKELDAHRHHKSSHNRRSSGSHSHASHHKRDETDDVLRPDQSSFDSASRAFRTPDSPAKDKRQLPGLGINLTNPSDVSSLDSRSLPSATISSQAVIPTPQLTQVPGLSTPPNPASNILSFIQSGVSLQTSLGTLNTASIASPTPSGSSFAPYTATSASSLNFTSSSTTSTSSGYSASLTYGTSITSTPGILPSAVIPTFPTSVPYSVYNSSTTSTTSTTSLTPSSTFSFLSTTSSTSSASSSSTTTIPTSSYYYSTSATPTSYYGGGESSAAPASTTSTPPPAPSNGTTTQQSTGGSTASAGTIAGSVIGAVAGGTILLALAFLFARWLKRRRDATAIAHSGAESAGEAGGTRGPEMSEGAGGTEVGKAAGASAGAGAAAGAAAGAGFFSRLGAGRGKQPEPLAPQERGFERLSGRKLPSQFSPGMEGPSGPTAATSAAALGAGASNSSGAGRTAMYPSGSSYPSGGTFLSEPSTDPFADPNRSPSPAESSPIGASAAADARQESASPSERERIIDGPARTPTIHRSDNRSSQLATPSSPTMPVFTTRPAMDTVPEWPLPEQSGLGLAPQRPGLLRNPSSRDSIRSSRFREDV